MKIRTKIVYLFNRVLKYVIKFHILDTDQSIEEVLKEKNSIVRYGDGELTIMLGGSIDFQEYNEQLAERLKRILICTEPNLLVAIPRAIINTDGYNQKAKDFWKNNMNTGRMHWVKLCDLSKTYCNASLTRLFIDYENKKNSFEWFARIQKLWENKNILIVEGEASKLGVGNDLFSNAKGIKRIIAPSKHAYTWYDQIFQSILDVKKDNLILISLGPTATVLTYDLHRLGIRAIDIGHIQLEYEEFFKYRYKSNIKPVKIISEDEYRQQICIEIGWI